MVVDVIDFSQEVLSRSYTVPVVVDFWASWCKACSILSPVLELLAQRHRGEWVLVKINVEEQPDVAIAYGVTAIPTVKLFVNGAVTGEFKGVVPGHTIEKWLADSLPRKKPGATEQARLLLDRGEEVEAEKILRKAISEDSHRLEAKVLLARAIFTKDPAQALDLVRHIEPVGQLGELADAIATLSRFTLETDTSSLPEGSARRHLLRAASALGDGKIEAVLEELISALQVDRGYLDGLAKTLCVALFRFLGENHPITARYRRKLGMVLYT